MGDQRQGTVWEREGSGTMMANAAKAERLRGAGLARSLGNGRI